MSGWGSPWVETKLKSALVSYKLQDLNRNEHYPCVVHGGFINFRERNNPATTLDSVPVNTEPGTFRYGPAFRVTRPGFLPVRRLAPAPVDWFVSHMPVNTKLYIRLAKLPDRTGTLQTAALRSGAWLADFHGCGFALQPVMFKRLLDGRIIALCIQLPP